MFERLQKPFLTTETGEAYQPIRIRYDLLQKESLILGLNQLTCCERQEEAERWDWFWRAECESVRFDSLTAYQRQPGHAPRLGSVTLVDQTAYLNLPSFKRACLAVSFFQKYLPPNSVSIRQADFVNKVFGIDETLPHGFTELFKEEDLDHIIHQRIADYEQVQARCERARSVEEALTVLADYTKRETAKRLPYAERYLFQPEEKQHSNQDPDVAFLGFYIFLRSRELVAIRRWFGQTNYTLSSAADEVIEQVFPNMYIDIIE